MTLIDDPAAFAAASLNAFATANYDRVIQVGSGVIRRDPAPDKVAVVGGGGAGHFPAFIGWVGSGIASAAVCGNVFSSPSEHQILEVVRRAEQGAGVLFIPINYAGDILHFTAAAERLQRESFDVRLVPVTDDIASGGPQEHHLRRGIAGSLMVMKIAGAAAERGYPLDRVEQIARAANDVTRSFGVAFSGCTLPGETAPLFTVPPGKMAVGLGIHGEPGVAEHDLGSASTVANVLIDGLFTERPAHSGQRVAVLVNGLGCTKYDELNLIFGHVRARLEEQQMILVAPVVGEYVTSLDMAGLSVTITYLDAELEELWRDPVDSVSYSRPFVAGDAHVVDPVADVPEVVRVSAGSAESRSAGLFVLKAFERAAVVIESEMGRLGDIDAVAGDGDHGMGMHTGIQAALDAARTASLAGAGVGTVLTMAGEQWSDVAGGTSGALWGAGLAAAGVSLGDDEPVDSISVTRAITEFGDAIARRGGAALGDKTMLDAIAPFTQTFAAETRQGQRGDLAWRHAAQAASAAAESTAQLASRRGRSRIHAARSVGTPDAGAVSFALIVRSVFDGES